MIEIYEPGEWVWVIRRPSMICDVEFSLVQGKIVSISMSTDAGPFYDVAFSSDSVGGVRSDMEKSIRHIFIHKDPKVLATRIKKAAEDLEKLHS